MPLSTLAPGPYDPQTAKRQRISPTGSAMVDQTTRLIGAHFDAALTAAVADTAVADNFWSVTLHAATGGAAAATAGQVATLTSGTTNANFVLIKSVRSARFLFANPNMWRGLIKFSAVAAANTTTFFGPVALTNGFPIDGYCFAVDGAGVVSVQSYSGGNGTALNGVRLNAASGFNGDLGATYSVPDTNMHAFEIIYFASAVWFLVDGVLLHKATPTTAPYSPNMTLPIGLSVVNGASPTSRVVACWDSSIVRFGKELTRPRSTYIAANATTLCKTGAGTLHRIILGSPVNGATISIYDGLTAVNLIATITSGNPAAGAAGAAMEMGMDFTTGLTVVTSGATTVTVIYD